MSGYTINGLTWWYQLKKVDGQLTNSASLSGRIVVGVLCNMTSGIVGVGVIGVMSVLGFRLIASDVIHFTTIDVEVRCILEERHCGCVR
jgi:hypothetical protein